MPEVINLTSTDGVGLVATVFRPQQANGNVILIAGATAVPQGFYRRFADYAAQQGFTLLSFDYRGIGLSAPKSLRGYQADFLDWGQKDLGAAIQYAHERLGKPLANELGRQGRLYLVGHSFAGHGLGMTTNHALVSAAAICGSGAGYHGYMPVPERYRVLLLWRVLAPILTRIYGCLPFKLLGMGEDLPMGVYRQWRHWCSFPHYFFDDPQAKAVTAGFAQVRTPLLLINAVDDLWAPPISRDAFALGYTASHKQNWDISAADTALPGVGHMGYYRNGAQDLWQRMLDWLVDQNAPTPP